MNLPRFTTGSVGRLTFEHVNEICSLVEQLRPLLTLVPSNVVGPDFDIVMARIKSADATNGSHEWEEVETKPRAQIVSGQEWRVRDGGRRS